jgi:hypothetical protein
VSCKIAIEVKELNKWMISIAISHFLMVKITKKQNYKIHQDVWDCRKQKHETKMEMQIQFDKEIAVPVCLYG